MKCMQTSSETKARIEYFYIFGACRQHGDFVHSWNLDGLVSIDIRRSQITFTLLVHFVRGLNESRMQDTTINAIAIVTTPLSPTLSIVPAASPSRTPIDLKSHPS